MSPLKKEIKIKNVLSVMNFIKIYKKYYKKLCHKRSHKQFDNILWMNKYLFYYFDIDKNY